jgi:hypothetical protein
MALLSIDMTIKMADCNPPTPSSHPLFVGDVPVEFVPSATILNEVRSLVVVCSRQRKPWISPPVW